MARSKTARANTALGLPLLRRLHVYVSVFVAPSLLFFAFTGALQTFRIPDQKTAPVLVQKLARLHKDDVFAVKPPRPKRADAAVAREKPAPAPPEPRSKAPLRWFFTAVSAGIGLTTLFGLWMALRNSRRQAIVWLLLVAGAAAPVLILAL